jgi:hypothetical protein
MKFVPISETIIFSAFIGFAEEKKSKHENKSDGHIL